MPIILIRARTARNDSAAIETLRAACLTSVIHRRHRSANKRPRVAPQHDLLATLRRRREVDASGAWPVIVRPWPEGSRRQTSR
jgi:hypothetical protein